MIQKIVKDLDDFTPTSYNRTKEDKLINTLNFYLHSQFINKLKNSANRQNCAYSVTSKSAPDNQYKRRDIEVYTTTIEGRTYRTEIDIKNKMSNTYRVH